MGLQEKSLGINIYQIGKNARFVFRTVLCCVRLPHVPTRARQTVESYYHYVNEVSDIGHTLLIYLSDTALIIETENTIFGFPRSVYSQFTFEQFQGCSDSFI